MNHTSFIRSARNPYSRVGCLSVVAFLASFAWGCTGQTSLLKSRTGTQILSESTTFSLESEQIQVVLTAADSERLDKALPRLVIQPVPAPDSVKSTRQFGQDFLVECKKTEQQPAKICTVTFKLKPAASENFVVSDTDLNEHMFHLRRTEDAQRLYSALAVKEWDLQGSMYKRFSSSDNKMILECISDAERSRCSVFLSDGTSDDLSD